MGKPTDEQRVIIENANANNMVIAAPGSGKSFTMIEAVISILRQFPYAKVGMVTFTRAATNSLAEKLKRRLSKKDQDRVLVNTFHGFIRMQLDMVNWKGKMLISSAQRSASLLRAGERPARHADAGEHSAVPGGRHCGRLPGLPRHAVLPVRRRVHSAHPLRGFHRGVRYRHRLRHPQRPDPAQQVPGAGTQGHEPGGSHPGRFAGTRGSHHHDLPYNGARPAPPDLGH